MRTTFHYAWIKAFRRKRDASSEKVSAIRIGAFAFTAALVMMFVSINIESTDGTARYFRTNTSDYVVTQKGSRSNVESSSVPVTVMQSLQNLDGVQAAGMTYYFGKLKGRDTLYSMYTPGGPIDPLLDSGRHIGSDTETVIDKDLAASLGISLGDSVRLVDKDFTVVGLSRETGSFGKEMVFISNPAMFHLYGSELYNQIAIKTNGHTITDATNASWGDSVELITQQEYINGIVDYWGRNVSPLIFTIIAIVTLLSLVSLLVFLINQLKLQLPTMAIFRTYGASRRMIGGIEGLAMSMLAVSGYVVAVPLGYLFITANNFITPGFHATLGTNELVWAASIIFGIAAIAVIVTWRRASKSTPMSLLRGQ
jgi:ABC-type antimicrobial peptide transport system permease subunit